MNRDQLRNELQLCFEDIALMRGEYLRLIDKGEALRRPLEEIWKAAGLGDLPAYEPEIRMRKVS
jgi:hypothetical protein